MSCGIIGFRLAISREETEQKRRAGETSEDVAFRCSLTRRANLAVKTVHYVLPQLLIRKDHAHGVSTRSLESFPQPIIAVGRRYHDCPRASAWPHFRLILK